MQNYLFYVALTVTLSSWWECDILILGIPYLIINIGENDIIFCLLSAISIFIAINKKKSHQDKKNPINNIPASLSL